MKLKVPKEKFYVYLQECGNTVSSTIPIALKQAACQGKLKPGQTRSCSSVSGSDTRGAPYCWSGLCFP